MAKIIAQGVDLELPLFTQDEETAKSWLSLIAGAALRRPKRVLATILSEVTFTIDEGERVAVLGRNGSGKSSLLHMLTGAYLPTRGSLDVTGSRQALMNISLGFNAEATVIENIYLRATAMGVAISDVHQHVDQVVEFAGLGGKTTHRLKTLSAGQRMRLGFSISTTVKHDITLLDEWIGTGDAEFIEKAKERMRSHIEGSKILVVATHNFMLARRLCTRAMWIENGRLAADGPVDEVIDAYKSSMQAKVRR